MFKTVVLEEWINRISCVAGSMDGDGWGVARGMSSSYKNPSMEGFTAVGRGSSDILLGKGICFLEAVIGV